MSRRYPLTIAALAVVLAVGAEVQAGKKLYVGNLPSASGFALVDRSTDPVPRLSI
jgi:hypothetical protein